MAKIGITPFKRNIFNHNILKKGFLTLSKGSTFQKEINNLHGCRDPEKE